MDYTNHDHLAYALRGVDLVISTISGQIQLNLINAAGHGNVRYFVPADFEGSLSRRPTRRDPLDRGSIQATTLLEQWSEGGKMSYTVFAAGIFMERFHPHGLGSLGIGEGSGVANPGDFVMNVNEGWAEYIDRNNRGNSVRVCLTSVFDVARFVVAAIDMGPANWPKELTMRGDRMFVRDMVMTFALAMNCKCSPRNGPYKTISF